MAPSASLSLVLAVLILAPAAVLAAYSRADTPALPTSSVQTHYNETATPATTDPSAEGCNCVCGLARRTRIVGGEEANEGEFPWLVALSRRGKFYCGGALISRKHVLTAAHCMYGMTQKDITVTMGVHNRSTSRWAPGRIERKLAKVSVHEHFDVSNFNNDIAILELSRAVNIDGEGELTRTVCLPGAERDYSGRMGTVTGWGRTGERRPVSDVLRKVEVALMSEDDCKKAGYPSTRITDNMICAGFPKGLKDACQVGRAPHSRVRWVAYPSGCITLNDVLLASARRGDSGGPLVLGAEDSPSAEVIGIVSWGRGCARPNFPGVYTRVHKFLPWIREQIKDTCLCKPAA